MCLYLCKPGKYRLKKSSPLLIISETDNRAASQSPNGTSSESPPNSREPPTSPMMGPVQKRMTATSATPKGSAKNVHITHHGVRETTLQQATTIIANLDGFTPVERLVLMKMLKTKFLSPDMVCGAGDLRDMWLRQEIEEYEKNS